MLCMLILFNSHKIDKIIVLTLCQALFLINFIILFYEEKNLRFREVKQLSQDDTASECQSHNSSLITSFQNVGNIVSIY